MTHFHASPNKTYVDV